MEPKLFVCVGGDSQKVLELKSVRMSTFYIHYLEMLKSVTVSFQIYVTPVFKRKEISF